MGRERRVEDEMGGGERGREKGGWKRKRMKERRGRGREEEEKGGWGVVEISFVYLSNCMGGVEMKFVYLSNGVYV